jgi:hypothetical protein
MQELGPQAMGQSAFLDLMHPQQGCQVHGIGEPHFFSRRKREAFYLNKEGNLLSDLTNQFSKSIAAHQKSLRVLNNVPLAL